MRPTPEQAGPGQESVWAYPRPAVAASSPRHLLITHHGVTVAESRSCLRTLETSHPPSYYVPQADVAMALLQPSARRSFCEWKGNACYFDLVLDGAVSRNVAWTYPDPSPDFMSLRDHVAFYAAAFDGCFIDGERVVPQPGGFYGGWITSHVAGPFKGGPGSTFW